MCIRDRCSSCPPADRWLGELSHRFTAEQVLALSLHVDYWDYIGWKDPFAQAQFSDRQRWLSQLGSSATIYTPEVFAGMKELRGWSNQQSLENRIQSINRQPARAQIALQMQPSGNGSVDLEARFVLDEKARMGRSGQGVVVLYEKHLSTEVRAGENRGDVYKRQGLPNNIARPVPSAASESTSTKPNNRRCALGLRRMPGSSGASARHSIGSAGRMYICLLYTSRCV